MLFQKKRTRLRAGLNKVRQMLPGQRKSISPGALIAGITLESG